MSLHDFFSSYGSFLSGVIGALVVVIGGLLAIRQKQAEIVTKVDICAKDREMQRQRIVSLEQQQQIQKKEIIQYVNDVTTHVHQDMNQLRADMCARADRSDKVLSDQLATLNVAISEVRQLVMQLAARRKYDYPYRDEG